MLLINIFNTDTQLVQSGHLIWTPDWLEDADQLRKRTVRAWMKTMTWFIRRDTRLCWLRGLTFICHEAYELLYLLFILNI